MNKDPKKPTQDMQKKKRRPLRILAFIVAGIVVILSIIYASLPYVVPMDRVKKLIVEQAEAAMHKKVTLDRVSLSTLPALTVHLEGLTIHNAKPWRESELLKVKTIDAKVALLPLLLGKIHVKYVIVDRVDLTLERSADGRLSIEPEIVSQEKSQEDSQLRSQQGSQGKAQRYSQRTSPRKPQGKSPGTTSGSAPGQKLVKASATPRSTSALASLSVAEIVITSVNASFIDSFIAQGQPVRLDAKDVGAVLRNLSLGSLANLDVSGTILSGKNRNMSLKGTLGPIPADLDMSATPLDVNLKVDSVALAALSPYLGRGYTLKGGLLAIELHVKGRVSDALSLVGTFRTSAGSLKDGKGNILAALPETTVSHALTVRLAADNAKIDKLNAKVGAIEIVAKGTVAKIKSGNPEVTLDASSNGFTPESLLEILPGLETAIPKPYDLQGKADFTARVTGLLTNLAAQCTLSASQIIFKTGGFCGAKTTGGLFIESRDIKLRGKASIVDYQPKKVDGNLTISLLVFKQKSGAEQSSEGPDEQPKPRDVEPGPPTDAKAPKGALPDMGRIKELAISRLKALDIALTDFLADFSLSDGKLQIQHQFGFYGGKVKGHAQADLKEKQLPHSVNLELAGINLGELSGALPLGQGTIAGDLSAGIRVSGKGISWDVLSKTLTGGGTLDVTNLKIRALNLMPKLVAPLEAVGNIAGFSLPQTLKEKAFGGLKGSFDVAGGKVDIKNISLSGEGINATISGALGFDQSLDLKGMAYIKGDLLGSRAGAIDFLLDKHGRIPIPFTIKGYTSSPSVHVSKDALVSAAKKALAARVKQKATDILKEKTGNALEEILGGKKGGKGGDTGSHVLERVIKNVIRKKQSDGKNETKENKKELEKPLESIFKNIIEKARKKKKEEASKKKKKLKKPLEGIFKDLLGE